MCGEYYDLAASQYELYGSPPRVRGIHLLISNLGHRKGITPACAGNTVPLLPPVSRVEDHPRVCGEYSRMPAYSHSQVGSPPRVRGIPDDPSQPTGRLGITPACAGNTKT